MNIHQVHAAIAYALVMIKSRLSDRNVGCLNREARRGFKGIELWRGFVRPREYKSIAHCIVTLDTVNEMRVTVMRGKVAIRIVTTIMRGNAAIIGSNLVIMGGDVATVRRKVANMGGKVQLSYL